jgi:mRNA interferase RelE/StbE
MDKLMKLLRKVSRKDRERLLAALEALEKGELNTLSIKKLSNSPFFRVRVGDFRIVFLLDEQTKTVVIESVRKRDEETYR